jgi:hypothetical protein
MRVTLQTMSLCATLLLGTLVPPIARADAQFSPGPGFSPEPGAIAARQANEVMARADAAEVRAQSNANNAEQDAASAEESAKYARGYADKAATTQAEDGAQHAERAARQARDAAKRARDAAERAKAGRARAAAAWDAARKAAAVMGAAAHLPSQVYRDAYDKWQGSYLDLLEAARDAESNADVADAAEFDAAKATTRAFGWLSRTREAAEAAKNAAPSETGHSHRDTDQAGARNTDSGSTGSSGGTSSTGGTATTTR